MSDTVLEVYRDTTPTLRVVAEQPVDPDASPVTWEPMPLTGLTVRFTIKRHTGLEDSQGLVLSGGRVTIAGDTATVKLTAEELDDLAPPGAPASLAWDCKVYAAGDSLRLAGGTLRVLPTAGRASS
jgi:hypothetical protein